MKKRIILLFLIFALALFCVSCANTNGDTPSDEASEPVSGESEAESEGWLPGFDFGESGIELPIDFFD